jgi:hypothetical protein
MLMSVAISSIFTLLFSIPVNASAAEDNEANSKERVISMESFASDPAEYTRGIDRSAVGGFSHSYSNVLPPYYIRASDSGIGDLSYSPSPQKSLFDISNKIKDFYYKSSFTSQLQTTTFLQIDGDNKDKDNKDKFYDTAYTKEISEDMRYSASAVSIKDLVNPIYGNLENLSNLEIDNMHEVDLSKMNLGNLISDYTMGNYGSMSEYDIKLFLDAQGRECKNTNGGTPCLKDYRGNIPNTPSGSKAICSAIGKQDNVSAARMLYLVANACNINPQVLIVHIQKEQGLVETNNPTSYMYKAAMGYNCPDTSGCIGGSSFWSQIRESAEQKIWYGHPESKFSRFTVGEKVTINLKPNSECGAKTFKLENQATASLYYYTPYIPDSAAIRAYPGTGGSCSSYGNRNFYYLFNQWFGDSTYIPQPNLMFKKIY